MVIAAAATCLCGVYQSSAISNLSHEWHDFRREGIKHKIHVLFSLQLSSKTFLILKRI
jgi:hypothetical protein